MNTITILYVSLLQQVGDVLFLRKDYTIGSMQHLNAQKIFKWTKIF